MNNKKMDGNGRRRLRGLLGKVVGIGLLMAPGAVVAESEVFGDWRVECKQQQCQASQQLFVGENDKRSRVLAASLMKVQEQRVLQLVFPLGVDLRPGIVIRIDDSQEQHFSFTTCVSDGCVALLPLNSELYAGMKAGKVMKAGFRPFTSEQTLVAELSLSGFTKASDKVR